MKVLLATRTDFLYDYISKQKKITITGSVGNFNDLLALIIRNKPDVIVINECLMYKNEQVGGLFLDIKLIEDLKAITKNISIILIGSSHIPIKRGLKDKAEVLKSLGIDHIFLDTYSKQAVLEAIMR